MSLLPWTILLSFAGAAGALAAGARSARAARWIALLTAAGILLLSLGAGLRFIPGSERTLADAAWIPSFGIRFHLVADGLTMVMVVLTGLAAVAGVLFSWNIEKRTGLFFAFYLTLIGGVLGVFLSADLLLFFVFYEIAIVPKYFLIAIWGSTNREYGAMKLALYSFVGSALVLAGVLWAHAIGGCQGFGLADLAAHPIPFGHGHEVAIFGLVFFGFAILAGLFPFHTWAPTGHVAAPTAASMLLAGVVMKLGAYGCLRVALPLFPAGFAAWAPLIGVLATIGIVYAGLIALIQEDFKFVIGYSSVSHMGFVILGLAAANVQAASGAVLQMFSHGIVAGLLFAVVGRMVYERTHTRRLEDLRAMQLYKLLPFAATVFVLAGLASMGMPGFSGFPAEFMILTGVWKSSHLLAVGGAVGVLVAAAFTLRAIQVAFFGSGGTGESGAGRVATELHHCLSPITLAEKAGALLLLAATVAIGLRPDWLLHWITPALSTPLFHAVLASGGAR